MAVIVGSDGCISFDFGDTGKFLANVFAWRVNLGRETLRTTNLGDEAEKRTGGLADHSGELSIRLQFAEDESELNSALQVLEFALNGIDDELKAEIELIVKAPSGGIECDSEIDALISDGIALTGTVVVGSISLDCSEPEDPVVANINWFADGALGLGRFG